MGGQENHGIWRAALRARDRDERAGEWAGGLSGGQDNGKQIKRTM
jgi:hypothetical protein